MWREKEMPAFCSLAEFLANQCSWRRNQSSCLLRIYMLCMVRGGCNHSERGQCCRQSQHSGIRNRIWNREHRGVVHTDAKEGIVFTPLIKRGMWIFQALQNLPLRAEQRGAGGRGGCEYLTLLSWSCAQQGKSQGGFVLCLFPKKIWKSWKHLLQTFTCRF